MRCKHCGGEINPDTWTHVVGDEPRCSEHGRFAEPADSFAPTLSQADVWVQIADSLKRIADAMERIAADGALVLPGDG